MSEKKESSKKEKETAGTVSIQGYEIPLIAGSPAMPHEKMVRRGVQLPYILFEKNSLTRVDGKTLAAKRYFELPLNGSHCYPERIQYYLDKGFKIVRYHVPSTTEAKKEFRDGFARDGYTAVLGADGQEEGDPFGIVLNFIEKITKGDAKQRALEEENQKLKEQLHKSSSQPNVKGGAK